jgi:hypothetical protein
MRHTSLLLALVALLLAAGRSLAQEATPGAEGTPIVLPTGLPIVPDPAACTVTALTIDELLDELGVTPAPSGPVGAASDDGEEMVGAATPTDFVLPVGEPADTATVDAIVLLMLDVVACLNSGDYLTFFAFTTDAFLARAQEASPITEEEVEFFRATPPALPADQYVTLVAVRDVTVLPDGSVGALVDTIFPDETDAVQTDYFRFVQVDGEWRIDEVVEDLEGQYPPEPLGTPAA